MTERDRLAELQLRERLIAREHAENKAAMAQAKAAGQSVVFIASDGCEVTVTPKGRVLHNVADWW